MQNRRNFLRNSMLALTGAGIAQNSFSSPINKTLTGIKEKKFVYRTLGNTGIKIPVVSMGTGNCDNPNLIREALDRGVKLFATSEYYGNGNNEKMLGEVLKERPRDSFYIMTGANGGLEVDHKNGLFKSETDPDKFLEHANGCLERLQVDYVDIFSLGFGAKRESVFYEPLLEALKTFRKEGKTKYLGLATHKFEPEAVRAAADTGVFNLVTVAYNFRKSNKEEIQGALQYATDAGLGVIGMKTMAGVYWDKEKKLPINTSAALKWVLQNDHVHTTIPDCSSFDELHQDLDIMDDMELSDEEMKDLQSPAGESTTGIYCQQCNQCVSQCPKHLDIPTMMRSYMYAYGYRNLSLARQTIHLAGLNKLSCGDCSYCQVNCAMGFDVRGKVFDVARIQDIPEDMIQQV